MPDDDLQFLTIPLDDLTEEQAALLAYWRGLPATGGMPTWRDFELPSVPAQLLPSTLVIDMAPKPEDCRFRYWGTGMTRVHGADKTGQCPYDLQPPELGRRIREDHQQVCDSKQPSAGVYGFTSANSFQQMQKVLRLPLSDDGETVTQIVVCIDYSEPVLDTMRARGITAQEAISYLKGR